VTLRLHELGDPAGAGLVALHGVTSHGRHFARLAQLLGRYRVLAPDLRGHGESDWEPPWLLERHLEDVLEAVGPEPRLFMGHSWGGRLVFEIAAREPDRVDRLVLLDPAVRILPEHGLAAAEIARRDRSYASVEEAIERRYTESMLIRAPRELLEEELPPHLGEDEDGRWRYRYSQSAVVAAYGEMTREQPPFPQVPTLLVLGEDSYVPYHHLLDAHRAAVGDLLQVVTVPGGHTLLWDALDETAAAIASFLED
jgi:lipase